MMLKQLKSLAANYLWLQTIKRHYSRMGRVVAPKYSVHLNMARAAYRDDGRCDAVAEEAASRYLGKGFTSYWGVDNRALADSILTKVKAEEREFGEHGTWGGDSRYVRGDIFQKFPEVEALFRGQTGAMIERIFGAHFKIYYGVMYKSFRLQDAPEGSQLWHSDGGPGTCINVMFCLNETDKHNGAMEFVPWDISVRLFEAERKTAETIRANSGLSSMDRRSSLCDYYARRIEAEFSDKTMRLTGEPGLVLAFRNNTIHRGGYPELGRVRYVCIFHVYPSLTETPWAKYRDLGVTKVAPYPDDPAF